MRISDWSSDVCSSDLGRRTRLSPALWRRRTRRGTGHALRRKGDRGADRGGRGGAHPSRRRGGGDRRQRGDGERGSAARTSVVLGKSVVVRVDVGGGMSIKKKKLSITFKSEHTP